MEAQEKRESDCAPSGPRGRLWLADLLEGVPNAFGPNFGQDLAAVTATHIGPNEIAFTAPADMAWVTFTP